MTTIDIDHLLEHEEIRQLLDSAEQSGSLRAAEVSEIIDTHELDPLEQEALVRELEQRGIEVVEEPKPRSPSRLRPAAVAPRRRRRTRCSSSCARPGGTSC